MYKRILFYLTLFRNETGPQDLKLPCPATVATDVPYIDILYILFYNQQTKHNTVDGTVHHKQSCRDDNMIMMNHSSGNTGKITSLTEEEKY